VSRRQTQYLIRLHDVGASQRESERDRAVLSNVVLQLSMSVTQPGFLPRDAKPAPYMLWLCLSVRLSQIGVLSTKRVIMQTTSFDSPRNLI